MLKYSHRNPPAHAPRGRGGFTLVEILVSLALTIFILSILAQAFVLGADTFRTLKAVGDLNDGLRTAANILRSDLAADHFEGKRRLSDTKFWNDGPPVQGYFVVWRDTNAATLAKLNPPLEGTDPDGLPVFRSAANVLAFTSKARGNRPQNFYSAQVPPGSQLITNSVFMPPDSRFQPGPDVKGNYFYSSQWLEVCWFLTLTKTATAGGTPLFALYRQPRLVVTDVDQLNWSTNTAQKVAASNLTSYRNKISCQVNPSPGASGYLYFNSPADLTIPQRRTAGAFPLQALAANFQPFVDPTTNQPTAEDLVLQDVLSFEVRVMLAGGSDFVPIVYFDTWSQRRDDVYDYSNPATKPVPPLQGYPLTPPTNYPAPQILAIQITIRVWDFKTQLARQITVIQDM